MKLFGAKEKKPKMIYIACGYCPLIPDEAQHVIRQEIIAELARKMPSFAEAYNQAIGVPVSWGVLRDVDPDEDVDSLVYKLSGMLADRLGMSREQLNHSKGRYFFSFGSAEVPETKTPYIWTMHFYFQT